MVIQERKRIILLGGSFNPAHDGHIHISLEALKMLDASEVWWLLSPQNPLKDADDIAEYDLRYNHASALLRDHPIHISRFEQEHQLTYSADTIRALKDSYNYEFIWLIGSDNLAGFHTWRDWQAIAQMVPIAVYNRAPYMDAAAQSEAYSYLSPHELSVEEARYEPIVAPALIPLYGELHPESGTRLRKKLGKSAFLAHNNS